MEKLLRDLGILLGSGLLLWGIFTLIVRLPERPQAISPAQEQKIGDRYRDLILAMPGFKALDNPGAAGILDKTAAKLHEIQESARFAYTITLIDNSMVNAFALPGGHILVTTGLIEMCDTQEELLAVICHEIGHIEKRHVINRLIREMGVSLLLSADPYVTGEVARMLISSGFNRKQEEEADLFACELMMKAGLEPRALAGLFRKMKEEQTVNLDRFEWIMSHPNLDARIRAVLEFPVPEDFTPREGWIPWNELREILGVNTVEQD